jgi:hypothetical protein
MFIGCPSFESLGIVKSLSTNITDSLSSIPHIDAGEIRKAQRIAEVRNIWCDLVEDVFIEHTNAVYIFKDDDRVQMHVYMDESIYAAELNNRRELIKLNCRERFGEVIDDFYIHISRGKKKSDHPFIENTRLEIDMNGPVALSSEEMEWVRASCSQIEDSTLRSHFEKAMITDLEWKKGNKH